MLGEIQGVEAMKQVDLGTKSSKELVERFAEIVVAQDRALLALEAIADTHWLPQAGDAGMSLSFLDRGVFKPT